MKRTEVTIVVVVVVLVCCLCAAAGSGLAALGYQLWKGLPGSTAYGTPVPTPVFAPRSLTPTPLAVASPAPSEAADALTSLQTAEVPVRDVVELAERLGGKKDVPRVVATSAEPVPLGTVRTFHASNVDTDENFDVSAALRYATPHVYFWVEEGLKVSDKDIQALVDRFEQKTYPTDREFFGSEWTPGVDGDVHLYMLLAHNLGKSIAGYYSSADEVSPLAQKYSNAHEMFDLNLDGLNLADDFTGGVLAHEFQHMIHWYQDKNEEDWLNEGASELAAFLNGFSMGGFDQAYAANTDLQLTFWPDPKEGDTSPHYGASFLFLDYYLNRFGSQATQALVRDQENGLESIDDAIRGLGIVDPQSKRPATADDLFADFAAALYLDDPGVGDGRYAFKNYSDLPAPTITESIAECPTGVEQRDVSQYGIDYIMIRCTGQYTLRFAGDTVVRAIPVDPDQGRYAVWSNRGDESDMTLTRAFDLPDATPITLQYRLWFDIEKDYDYAYIEVSQDGGTTWQILKTPSGTGTDPQGANYGWGYTGKSGGGSVPAWVSEQVDLSAYAGKHVLVRFEYVTDPAVNGEGMLLDELSIPQANYQTDFESDLGGWQADGFVRLENQLPQTYRVLLIQQGKNTTVTALPLSPSMDGELPVSIAPGERAVVVVMGTTRFTRQKAPYEYEIVP